jgi:hypothetical protein
MKKLIMILVAAAAFSCGDGNRTSGANDGDLDGTGGDNTEMSEPDSTSVESDTTSTDMNRRQDNTETDRGEAGTERDSL